MNVCVHLEGELQKEAMLLWESGVWCKTAYGCCFGSKGDVDLCRYTPFACFSFSHMCNYISLLHWQRITSSHDQKFLTRCRSLDHPCHRCRSQVSLCSPSRASPRVARTALSRMPSLRICVTLIFRSNAGQTRCRSDPRDSRGRRRSVGTRHPTHRWLRASSEAEIDRRVSGPSRPRPRSAPQGKCRER